MMSIDGELLISKDKLAKIELDELGDWNQKGLIVVLDGLYGYNPDVPFEQSLERRPITKTSAEWNKKDGVLVLNPDGWKRDNFQYSWYEELITQQEYLRRLSLSTIKR